MMKQITSNNDINNPTPTTATTATTTTLRKPIDPTLLARGMTARSIGSRISSHYIKPLTIQEIEKDIRHMEAYASACIVYTQQHFSFMNRDAVLRGQYGSTPPVFMGGAGDPHLQQQQQYQQPMFMDGNGIMVDANGHPIRSASNNNISLPVRIDPEEEKRLSTLRNNIASSEAKREILETEYLSLRAHYVHESHKLRRSQNVMTGQMKLLKDLVEKRGYVLALYRAKYAMAKDVLCCLEYRSKLLKNGNGGVVGGAGTNGGVGSSNSSGDIPTATPMEGVEEGTEASTTTTTTITTTEKDATTSNTATIPTTTTTTTTTTPAETLDLTDIWDMIEYQLQDAELACTGNVSTPEELLQMKAALAADALALETATERAAMFSRGGSSGGDDDNTTSSGATGGGKKRKKSNNNADDNNTDGNGSKRTSLRDGSGDSNVIPWNCPVVPRTPYDVAILLSNLSTATDGSAAFACGDLKGKRTDKLIWLEANLPSTKQDEKEKEEERLQRVREDVKLLREELDREVKANSDLQKEIIKGKKRRDQLCSMMSMIRSETEAVLERFNDVLQTPEAMAEVEKLLEDESLGYQNGYDDDDGELGDGENSEDGTMIDDDVDGEGNNNGDFVTDKPEMYYDDENTDGPMKEITVRI